MNMMTMMMMMIIIIIIADGNRVSIAIIRISDSVIMSVFLRV